MRRIHRHTPFLSLAMAGAAATLLFALPRPEAASYTAVEVGVFALLTFLAEMLSVPLPNGRGYVSVSFAVIYAGVLLFGPFIGGLVAGMAAMDGQEVRGRKPWDAFLFNRAQLATSAALAGLTYTALGGSVGRPDVLAQLLPLAAGGLVYFLVNITLVSCFISLRDRSSLWNVWVGAYAWSVPNYLALLPLAVLLAVVFSASGYLGMAFFFLPLLVARHSFQQYAEMRTAYLATIGALAAALDAKDPYTAGHAKRVGEMAVRIGRELGFGERRLEFLQYAGILHDIGKIGVSDRVLKKMGRYTPEEYDEMKRHPELGGRILADVPFLTPIVPWVTHHHEAWNGTGYPAGLAGEAIPLEARIIAVADSFDAMISRRVYKHAMSYEAARREVERCAGEQFDPEVVRVFLRITADPEVRARVNALLPYLNELCEPRVRGAGEV